MQAKNKSMVRKCRTSGPSPKKRTAGVVKKVALETVNEVSAKEKKSVKGRNPGLRVHRSIAAAELVGVTKQEAGVYVEPIPKEEAILSVAFRDAMQISPLLGELGKQVQFELVKHIASHGGDVLATALTGATITLEKGAVVARFTAKASKLVNARELRFLTDASGRRLPTLINASGRTVENARILGPLTTGTRIAANLTIAAVTVAHIVSGADLAKKLNKVGAKVDFLVAAHRIDQLARIEGVYCQAKEILHMEQNEETRWELHRLGRELFEVRSAWRREIAQHVGSLEKTEESKNRVVRFFQGFSRKGKDENISTTVSAREAEIQLISGSIAIHLALAQASGTLETFLKVSLPDELDELQRVRDLLHDRRDFIDKNNSELRDNVSDVCAKLDNVTNTYRAMVISRFK